MLRVISCLTLDHDWRLVLVAAAVCLIATLTAFRLYALAASQRGSVKFAWVAFGGFAGGGGVWVTHFIAMLAYEPGLQTGYEPVGTIASLVLAIIATAAGFGLAARKPTTGNLIAGGAVLGLGISIMHYAGMAAYRIQGALAWDFAYVAVSAAIGVAVAAAAVLAAGEAARLRDQLVGAGLFTLAICSMHFTGMGAVAILPDPAAAVPHAVFDRGIMAVALSTLAVVLALGGVGTVAIAAFLRRSSQALLQSAIELIPHPYAVFDAEDRFVLWNRAYAELSRGGAGAGDIAVGLSFRTCLERGLASGVYPEAAGREEAWLEARIAARRSAPSSFEQETADGRWMRIEEQPMPDGGTASICVDLTDLKRGARALEQARDEAQAANRAKTEFLANMSHEIRTPLNGVMGAIDLVARGDLDPKRRELVDIIQASARTLDSLLGDVLDMARIESGRIEIRPEPFNLADLVRDLCALHEASAHEKRITLEGRIPPEAETWVVGDPVRLRQILANLVSNAVKFTEAGGVLVSVAPVAGRDHAWRLAVRDTGIGMSQEEHARAFGRFEQADGSITRRHGGAGLGLAICKQLSELLGAPLECESAPEAGSTFSLVIDLPPTEAPAAMAAPEPVAPEDLSSFRVLLADDHPTNRTVIGMILAQAQVELTAVENGRQAVEAFRSGRYDLVLMDMQMPVMDGLTATSAIRAFEREAGLERTPLLMVTANAMPQDVEASLQAGADRHIPKPVSAATLLSAVAAVHAEAEDRHAA